MSIAAKWKGEKEIIYFDVSKKKDFSDDKDLVKEAWDLLNFADIVITQNGKRFDIKKLNARFIKYGLPPPSTFRQMDTLQIAKRYFSITSNKLEFLAEFLGTTKKVKVRKFMGHELWKACLEGDKAAWSEMRRYNIGDIVTLEEVYNKLTPWEGSTSINTYFDDEEEQVCRCGSKEFRHAGYRYTNTGKYKRLRCKSCGANYRERKNLLSKKKKGFLILPDN